MAVLRLLVLLSLQFGQWVSSTQELNLRTFELLIASGENAVAPMIRCVCNSIAEFLPSQKFAGRNGMIKFYQPWCGE